MHFFVGKSDNFGLTFNLHLHNEVTGCPDSEQDCSLEYSTVDKTVLEHTKHNAEQKKGFIHNKHLAATRIQLFGVGPGNMTFEERMLIAHCVQLC